MKKDRLIPSSPKGILPCYLGTYYSYNCVGPKLQQVDKNKPTNTCAVGIEPTTSDT